MNKAKNSPEMLPKGISKAVSALPTWIIKTPIIGKIALAIVVSTQNKKQ